MLFELKIGRLSWLAFHKGAGVIDSNDDEILLLSKFHPLGFKTFGLSVLGAISSCKNQFLIFLSPSTDLFNLT